MPKRAAVSLSPPRQQARTLQPVRVKVPLEVALVLIVAVIAIWALIGVGALGRWIDAKLPPWLVRLIAGVTGVATYGGAAFLLSTFYLVEDQRDPVHRGVGVFDLGDVALCAVLLAAGSAAFYWSRFRTLGAVTSIAAGVALVLKPIVRPLRTQRSDGSWHDYGFTSETHLYFVLSGLALTACGIAMLMLWRKHRAKPQ